MSTNSNQARRHLARVGAKLRHNVARVLTENAAFCATEAERRTHDVSGDLDHGITSTRAAGYPVVVASAEAKSDHAVPHEFGNSHSPPRPFWRPAERMAIERLKDQLPHAFQNAIK